MLAISIDNHGENAKSNHSWNTTVHGIQELYFTLVSVELEGRLTMKLSLEFHRSESRVLVTLSKLNEILLNLQVWVENGSVPERSRTFNGEKQELSEV